MKCDIIISNVGTLQIRIFQNIPIGVQFILQATSYQGGERLLEFIPLGIVIKVTIIHFTGDYKHLVQMDTSESGDDLGNNFLPVESQTYMVQEDLDGRL